MSLPQGAPEKVRQRAGGIQTVLLAIGKSYCVRIEGTEVWEQNACRKVCIGQGLAIHLSDYHSGTCGKKLPPSLFRVDYCASWLGHAKTRPSELHQNVDMTRWKNFPDINPLNPELNPICYSLALFGAHHFLHISRIRVKLLTLR